MAAVFMAFATFIAFVAVVLMAFMVFVAFVAVVFMAFMVFIAFMAFPGAALAFVAFTAAGLFICNLSRSLQQLRCQAPEAKKMPQSMAATSNSCGHCLPTR